MKNNKLFHKALRMVRRQGFIVTVISILLLVIADYIYGTEGQIVYIFAWTIFMLWFGYKHAPKQFKVSLLLAIFYVIYNLVINPYSSLMQFQTIFILAVSSALYVSSLTKKQEHDEMNAEYIDLKERLHIMEANRNALQKNVARYNRDIKMMASIYELTKKMVAVTAFDDMVNLVVGFLNNAFMLDKYVMFLYDSSISEYRPVYSHEMTDVLWNRIKPCLSEEQYFIGESSPIVIDRENELWKTHFNVMPEEIESCMYVPFGIYGTLTGGAFLFSSHKEYFEHYLIKYFIILSRQIALGFKKIYLYEEVREKSRRDELTRFFTRGYWDERFEAELKKAERYGHSLALLMIDIDFFKEFNDKYGHLIGDEVLRVVSHTIRSTVYSTDIIGRYGGEEFAIVMP
ncbi:MAG: GGDEF domain-containing protein, partial [Elusimicrobiota bacterium]